MAMTSNFQPERDFNAVLDAEFVRKCLKKKNYQDLINIAGQRNCLERCVIAQKYKVSFGVDILASFRADLVGDFRILMEGLFVPQIEFLVKCLRRAMKGFGTCEKSLYEILVPCTNEDIKRIKETYLIKYGRDIETDLRQETSGHFRRILVSLIQGGRVEDPLEEQVNQEQAQKDAQDLYKAGEARWGTDEGSFNAIMCNRSWPQLRLTFDQYENLSKKNILQVIRSEFSGDICSTHLAIAKMAINSAAFHAELLHRSMKGLGTDDDALIRIIISRCELDIKDIKKEYMTCYKRSLADDIRDDTSGNYQQLLLLLIKEAPPPKPGK